MRLLQVVFQTERFEKRRCFTMFAMFTSGFNHFCSMVYSVIRIISCSWFKTFRFVGSLQGEPFGLPHLKTNKTGRFFFQEMLTMLRFGLSVLLLSSVEVGFLDVLRRWNGWRNFSPQWSSVIFRQWRVYVPITVRLAEAECMLGSDTSRVNIPGTSKYHLSHDSPGRSQKWEFCSYPSLGYVLLCGFELVS